MLHTADTENSLYVGCKLLYYFTGMNIEISHLLIGSTLCKREPVTCSLVVDSQLHTAECRKLLAYLFEMLVRNIRIYRHRKYNVLSVTSYITHTGERLVVGCSADTALICKIVVIGIIPLKCDLLVLESVSRSCRPCFIKRIIAIHKAYRSVRSAQLVQDIILVYILSSFTSVAKVNRTFSRTHVDLLDLAHVNKLLTQLFSEILIFKTYPSFPAIRPSAAMHRSQTAYRNNFVKTCVFTE